jgi:lipopolysaccharide/colanic/teichoic acid biosynthesis glycosyltransferase
VEAQRVVDILLAGVLIVLTLPMMLVAAVGSAVALRAWPFFTQDRVGRDGQLFRFVKIRTLPVHTPRYTDKHQLKAAEIPRFCAMLRRLHLDELPQLFLVVRGRMSMVGPRPEMAWLHDQMPEDFATARTSVRPGATGLWQVSEACADLIHASPDYDLFYLANRSLRLDLWVLGRTTKKMLGIGGRVTLATVPDWAIPAVPETAVAFTGATGR